MALRTSSLFIVLLLMAAIIMVLGALRIWNQGNSSPVTTSPSTSNDPAGLSSLALDESAEYAPLKPRESNESIEGSLVSPREIQPVVMASNTLLEGVVDAGPTNWEDQINLLLESDLDDTNIAFRLLALIPKMPTLEKVEATEHMLNLMPDESYAAVEPLLEDVNTDQETMDVLISDLLLRPESLQLPLFLNMARNPNHPGRADARDYLELYLGEDYGEDWNAWNAAMTQWLQNNP